VEVLASPFETPPGGRLLRVRSYFWGRIGWGLGSWSGMG
jgi:hypothetical protein